MKKTKSKLITFGISLLLVCGAIYAFSAFRNGEYQVYEVTAVGDLVVTTEVSGKVVPGQEIDLSFESTGKVGAINVSIGDTVRAGDVLARLNAAQIDSEIEEALANLSSAEAQLREITDAAVLQSKSASAKDSLVAVLKKAYVGADDVVRNNIDTFFDDGNSTTPEFSKSLSGYYAREDIEKKRKSVEELLSNWDEVVVDLTVDTVTFADAELFIKNLKQIEVLLSTISSYSGDFSPIIDKTQAQIDAYIATISKSRTTIATLIVDINAATESVRSVEAEVPVLTANVNSARATVERLRAKADTYILRAPFDGVITDEDVELGVVVNAGDVVMSMVSTKPLEIESFVPEVNIAGIDLGDSALVTLDAFGDEV